MGHGVRLTIVAAGLVGVSAGCVATRQWTHELLGNQQAEMDDRFVKVEGEVREHGERLDQVEHRVSELETRSVRKTALMERTPSAERSSGPVARGTPQRTLVGVVHVPFAFDRADLVASAESALASIVTQLRDDPHMTVDLEGATDPVGPLEYNLKLSRRRVEAVKRRLLEQGVEPIRITSTARGPVLDSSVKNDLKRRVVIKLMKSTD